MTLSGIGSARILASAWDFQRSGTAAWQEKMEKLVHKTSLEVADKHYEVLVYSRPDGSHIAKTFFNANDVIINDGVSMEEVLVKHRQLLPLAVNSREILRQLRGPLD